MYSFQDNFRLRQQGSQNSKATATLLQAPVMGNKLASEKT